MSIYPGAIPSIAQVFDYKDDVNWMYERHWDAMRDELIACLTELGTSPSGASETVAARLALLALKASPTFTGQATIPTINLTGGQITFPAEAVPSEDPNTIDDYEKGTFTVTITCGTSGTVTLKGDGNLGAYTKIGRVVHVQGLIVVDSVSSPVGAAEIILPVTCATFTEYAEIATGAIAFNAINYLSTGWVVIRTQGGAAYALLLGTNDDGAQIIEAADIFSANGQMAFGLTYIAE